MQAAGVPPTEYVYSARITAASKQVRRTSQPSQPPLNAPPPHHTPSSYQQTLRRLLPGCCGVLVLAQGRVEVAEKLFDEMTAAGLAPTVVTCTNLLVAQVCGSLCVCVCVCVCAMSHLVLIRRRVGDMGRSSSMRA